MRALKYHGGAELATITDENLDALGKGIVNLERHVNNVQNVFGIPCVVSINKFTADTDAEIALLRERVAALGAEVVLATHWADGGKGTVELANKVVELCERDSELTFCYEDDMSLWDKMNAIATRIYGAAEVTADSKVRKQIADLQAAGYGKFPVCVAKTQYSFSTDAKLRGAPSNHSIDIREVRLSAGAEFVVMVCGDIMTMPGLPKVPSAEKIDLIDGKVVGLF